MLQSWLEAEDIEKRTFAGRTWIPLLESRQTLEQGRQGYSGFRREYQSIECLIVPVKYRKEFSDASWQSVQKTNPHSAYADQKRFFSPSSYYGSKGRRIALYPVLRQAFDTGEPSIWHPLQELEVGLGLMRQGDIWICPDEDNLEVIRLERNADSQPVLMQIRAEHLRDYLCARKSALLLTGFLIREVIEEPLLNLTWGTGTVERKFAMGEWEGFQREIYEGGHPVGIKTHVLRLWRESVNPKDDVPIIPKPWEDPEVRSESFDQENDGKILNRAQGRIWWKEWIEPGSKSPRIRRDEVEARVPFIVENQEQGALAGKTLRDHWGWLWFRATVIRDLLGKERSEFRWYTQATGKIGPVSNQTVHFGVNPVGLINVRAKEIGHLAEWAQRIWAKHNVTPEGGLSEELHQSQNLAAPAETVAPEMMLMNNVGLLQQMCRQECGEGFFRKLPEKENFSRTIHRFYTASFEEVCLLCKELSRSLTEQINTDLLDTVFDPKGAADAKKQNLRQIKRVELWLSNEGVDGRATTAPLVGVNELRQADAHAKASVREPLRLFDIPDNADDYQRISFKIIVDVLNCFAQIGQAAQSALAKRKT